MDKKDMRLEISKAVEPLEGLYDVVQCIIENFGLDNVELTEDQKLDLITRHEMLFNCLHHVQSAVKETLDNVQPSINGCTLSSVSFTALWT